MWCRRLSLPHTRGPREGAEEGGPDTPPRATGCWRLQPLHHFHLKEKTDMTKIRVSGHRAPDW